MKMIHFAVVMGSVALAAEASGDWSLSLVHVSDNAVTGFGPSKGFGPSTTWQVWAEFSTSTDVSGVLAQPGQPMFMHVIFGTIFNQVTTYGFHQNFPPTQGQINAHSSLSWALDTFVTIGALTSPSTSPGSHPNVAFTPGFADLINNLTGSWTTSDLPNQEGGWIALDMPDFAHGTDLLLMQLTVSQGALFEIVLGLDTLQLGYLHDWNGISFATHGVTGSGASYLTNIPAPGTAAIALLAFAGIRSKRRRECSAP